MGEIWKPIEGFENFSVSNLGRIRRTTISPNGQSVRYKFMKTVMMGGSNSHESTRPKGLYCRFTSDGDTIYLSVAELTARAFLENFDADKHQIYFKDGSPLNNAASNLAYQVAA